jgi:hypothetical protein
MAVCFKDLNDVKIDVNIYVEEYKKIFSFIVNQKVTDRSHKIERIMNELKEKRVFELTGDESFKEKIYSNIRELLEVRPGRILMKELIKLSPIFESIVIRNGEKFWHHPNHIIDVNLNKCSDDNYNAMCGSKIVGCSKPKSITLAHELIHELHERERELQSALEIYRNRKLELPGPLNEFKEVEIYPNPCFRSISFEGFESQVIFEKLTNLEEQHTIVGVNIPRFLKKKKLNKLDILSENVFLCACNLLPRVDHQQTEIDCGDGDNQLNRENLSSYYQWLHLQLNKRNGKVEKAKYEYSSSEKFT